MALSRPEGALRVDVLSAQGARLGSVFGALRVTRTRKLDGPGNVVIEIPAQDPAALLCQPGRSYQVVHATAGTLGQWRHSEDAVEVRGDAATLRLSGLSTAAELGRRSARFNRRYEDMPAITALLDLRTAASAVDTYPASAPTWTFVPHDSTGALLQHITLDIQGQSLLTALDAIRRATRTHWRETAPYRIEIGTFGVGVTHQYGDIAYGSDLYLGTVSAADAIQAMSIEAASGELDTTRVAPITAIAVTRQSAQVANRIIPVGAGEGLNMLTLASTYQHGSRTTPYPVRRMANPDGTWTYYVEDQSSIDAYGLTEIVLSRSDVRPITNSEAGIRLASDSLYDIAAAMLTRSAAPSAEYRISVAALPAGADVGASIRLRYRGLATFADDAGSETYRWIDVDTYCTVVAITETYDENGVSVTLVVSTTGERQMTDTDIIVALQQELNAQRVRVQPYPCRDTIAESGMVQAATSTRPAFTWEMQVPIGNEVLYVQSAILTLKLQPLRSTLDSAGAATTATNQGNTLIVNGHVVASTGYNRHASIFNGDNPFEHDMPASSDFATYYNGDHWHRVYAPHHAHEVPPLASTVTLHYGIYDDPGEAGMPNTPTDLTVRLNGDELIGPITPGNNNVQVFDITSALSASATLRQVHRLTFGCGQGRGIVQASVRLFLGVQATVPTV